MSRSNNWETVLTPEMRQPQNGTDCFFSESSFTSIMGLEMSFEEKFELQIERSKSAPVQYQILTDGESSELNSWLNKAKKTDLKNKKKLDETEENIFDEPSIEPHNFDEITEKLETLIENDRGKEMKGIKTHNHENKEKIIKMSVVNKDKKTIFVERSDHICLIMPGSSDEDEDDSYEKMNEHPTTSRTHVIKLEAPEATQIESKISSNSKRQDKKSAKLWPAEDIPIFSVKEPSPVKKNKLIEKSLQAPTQSHGKYNIWMDVVEKSGPSNTTLTPSSSQTGQKTALDYIVTGPIQHNRRSKLSKAEHMLYMEMFKKFVIPTMHGNPPALTSSDMKDLVTFEKLHKEVSKEQEDYQIYLKHQAQNNTKAYSYIPSVARKYAIARAQCHRLDHRLFAQSTKRSSELDISLNTTPLPKPPQLTFYKTLLEIGTPSKVKIPNVSGAKPLKMYWNRPELTKYFPIEHYDTPDLINHHSVSNDYNAKSLAESHGITYVMSSSVIKCLVDNHPPSFNRAWDIPVTVEPHPQDSSKTIIFLDKPMYKEDMITRHYNTLFNKYLLKSYICNPKRPVQQAKKTSKNKKQKNTNVCIDDPFDIFGGVTESLETFGISRLSTEKKTVHQVKEDKKSEKESEAESSEGNNFKTKDFEKLSPKRLRSSKLLEDQNNLSCPAKSVIEQDKIYETDFYKLNNSNLSLKKSTCIKVSHNMTRRSASSNKESNVNEETTNNFTSIQEPKANLKAEKGTESKKRKSENYEVLKVTDKKLKTWFSPRRKSSQSECEDKELSSQSIPLPREDYQLSTSCPLSTTPEEETPRSPEPDMSPKHEATDSCVQVIPTSPIKQLELPLISQRKRTIKDDIKSKLSVNEIKRKKLNPLDDILGPSTSDNSKPTDSELILKHLDVFEACTSICYNMWVLNSIPIIIRCNTHGTVPDKQGKGKGQPVYINAKMEYQPTHGFEQVTLSEVSRCWAACYIRPSTKLLRARINAFTSEVLTADLVETDKIIQTSLSFRPQCGIQVLDTIISKLQNLKTGRYILSHESGKDKCCVKKVCTDSFHHSKKLVLADDRGVFMHPLRATFPDGTVPWIPIDTSILTTTQHQNGRVPGTFLPKDCLENKKMQQQRKGRGKKSEHNNDKNDKKKKGKNKNK